MGKKILVITGSPRIGNSFALTDAFIKAVEARGYMVTRFDAGFMKVNGCRDCQTCFQSGMACSDDDDFNKIAPAIQEADTIVLTMPVYWYSIPAQIKAVIDKLFSFMIGGKNLSGKGCALISCCEDDDVTAFNGVKFAVERSAALLGWKMVGEVLVPGVLNPGDVEKTDGCARAVALAEKI